MSDSAPLASAPDDATIQQVMAYTHLSKRQVYRLCQTGDLESYLLGSLRRITWASVHCYRERCRAAGPQLEPRQPIRTGKRTVGRPKKPAPTPAAE